MAEQNYTVPASRMLPLHNLNSQAQTPHSTIQSITMGIRIGSSKYAIGFIHKFSFEMKRDNKTIYQIEPYPGIRGDETDGNPADIVSSFTDAIFDENTTYWPGEAVEIIPGKMGVIDITLSRYSLYTANLMAATMRATGSGMYNPVAVAPNLIEASTATPIQYVNILQQVRPFDIYQIFVSPLTGTVLWGRKFGGCWFTSIGEETPDSDKNEPVMENGKLQAVYIRPLTANSLTPQTTVAPGASQPE